MKRFLGLSLVTAMVVGITYFSFFSVGEHEAVIVTRFGNPVRTVEKAGPYFKMPGFIDYVNRFDTRLSVFETQPTQLLLGDKNPLIISCFVTWAIDDPLAFFQSVGLPENAVGKIEDMVSSQLSIVLGNYEDSDIINTNPGAVKLTEIEDRLLKATGRNALKQYGVHIETIGVKRLAYPETVIQAVYDRMKSERSKEAVKIRAEGREEANKISSRADKEAREIKAEAEKRVLLLKGEGDRDAMKIYSEAFNRDKEFFDFIQSLETYGKVLGKDTTLILSTKSELFKHLDIENGK